MRSSLLEIVSTYGVIEVGNRALVTGLIMVQSLELRKNKSSKSVLWGLEEE